MTTVPLKFENDGVAHEVMPMELGVYNSNAILLGHHGKDGTFCDLFVATIDGKSPSEFDVVVRSKAGALARRFLVGILNEIADSDAED